MVILRAWFQFCGFLRVETSYLTHPGYSPVYFFMAGADKVYVHVNKNNMGAQKLYDKIGFKVHHLAKT